MWGDRNLQPKHVSKRDSGPLAETLSMLFPWGVCSLPISRGNGELGSLVVIDEVAVELCGHTLG